MYLSAGSPDAIVSRLSRTCCAVTFGPKQYHEHQPVGGRRDVSGGWFLLSRVATSASSADRSVPLATITSSSVSDSPGASVAPSPSTMARSDDPATSKRPLKRAHDV